MKNNHTPEVRFSEFNKNWEHRKFKDFSSNSGKKNTMGENYPAYSVSNKLGLVSQTEQFDGSRLDNLDKTSYKLVNPNEFAYNPARINVGSIAFNNLNKTVIVSSLYVVLKMSEKLDNEFILQFIKSHFFIDEVRRNTEGSVREYLFFENFKNIKFPYTSNKDEQVKIGQFLKKLDDTISLHQQELDILKQTKQGFLQKMFPKEGTSVPEVRFPGFAGDWDKKTMGKILNEYTDKSKVEDEFELLSSTNNGMEVRNGRVSGTSNIGYKIIRKGNVVLSPQNLWLGNINYNSEFEIGIVSPSYKTYNILNSDKNFIAQYIRLPQMFKEYEQASIQGASVVRRNLDPDLFNKIPIFVPSIEEQQKIGEFFKQLDDTIELHQRELDVLKETKKAFLQKMFI